MKKQVISVVRVSALAIVLSFGISYALAWTAPLSAPTTGNVAAPINTGSTDQTKTGDLCTSKGGTTKCLSNTQIAAPSGTLSSSPTTIQEGGSTTITWTAVSGATSCTLYNPNGTTNKVLSASDITNGGSVVATITSGQGNSSTAYQIFAYTLTCTGAGGQINFTAPVTVLAPYSITVTNGATADVTIRSGVTKVTFQATGGHGGNGWEYGGAAGAYDGGGGGAGAFTGSTPIVIVGGGGGAASGPGGVGGTTASGNGAGAGGSYYTGTNISGQAGSVGQGGNGYLASSPSGIGGATSASGTTGTGAYPGGGGLGSVTGTLTGGTGYYGGGGGGGYGGGGGGYGDYATFPSYGSGGGGGSYFASGVSPAIGTNAPSGRTWALSNPTVVHLVSGLQGLSSLGNRASGNSGTITMSW